MHDITLCIILISRLEIWPEKEDIGNMTQLFSNTSVALILLSCSPTNQLHQQTKHKRFLGYHKLQRKHLRLPDKGNSTQDELKHFIRTCLVTFLSILNSIFEFSEHSQCITEIPEPSFRPTLLKIPVQQLISV